MYLNRSSLPVEKGAALIHAGSSAPLDGSSCRLLYVVGQLALGGLERQLYYLLSTLDRRRYRPALVAWNLDPTEKYYRDIAALGIPIYGLSSTASPIAKLWAFRKLARALSPEVIHSYGFHTNFAAYYAASATGAVAVGSLRSDFSTAWRAGGKLRGALNARWPSYHISNSVTCAVAAQQESTFFIPKQFAIVRNGLDLDTFRCVESEPIKRAYAVGVGSLLPVKRWDRCLRAIRAVNADGREPIRFCIAGEGPLRSRLEREAVDLGLSGIVQFLGAVHDMPTLLRGAKLLIHTSESEGCPNVVMEAMACGLPVVAMEAGDISYLIDNGRTGFIVGQNDDSTLVERLRLLLDDVALCRHMGEAGREKAQQKFSLEQFASETLRAYKEAGWRDCNAQVS